MSILTNYSLWYTRIMKIYEIRISHSALADMDNLRIFLDKMLSEEGAVRYANNMRSEINSLSVFADCIGRSSSKTIRSIHPDARRMVSHNRRWIYVYHIEQDFVLVDRIIPAKMNK